MIKNRRISRVTSLFVSFVVGGVVTISPIPVVASPADPVAAISTVELENHVSALISCGTRSIELAECAGADLERRGAGHDCARDYIARQFEALGYAVEQEDVNVPAVTCPNTGQLAHAAVEHNVVATKIGTVYPNEFIEFTGHFDGYGPGADDNASGTASVIELARVLKDSPSRYSIRFIAFGAEEMNPLAPGAMVHTEKARLRGERINVALNMDTTASLDATGAVVAHLFYRSPKSLELGELLAAISREKGLSMVTEPIDLGTQFQAEEKVYVRKGIPAITTFSAYERFYQGSPEFKCVLYHTNSDTIGSRPCAGAPYSEYSFASIAMIAKANLAAGLALDQGASNWFSQQAAVNDRVRGDFNGDGIDDLIVVDENGSTEYLGQSAGNFVASGWTRPDLVRGDVEYTVGNFNGDSRDDLLITVASGTFEYLGMTEGGFLPDVWWHAGLKKGYVEFTVGEFSGDTADDLIISIDSGSFEYLGKSGIGGGFTPDVWWRTDLKRRKVAFKVGEFSGDTQHDLIITVDSGSFEYLGKPGGGFTPDAWAHIGLTKGTVDYTVGDFSGDGLDDLIIAIDGGSFEYLGKRGGGFTPDVWWRLDLTRRNVTYASGNFNGDTQSDLLITIDGNTYEYLGKLGGGFTPDAWARSVTTRFPTYVVGRFDNDNTSDVIVQESVGGGGSSLLRGTAGPSGGFSQSQWTRPEWTLQSVSYY